MIEGLAGVAVRDVFEGTFSAEGVLTDCWISLEGGNYLPFPML
jgi:hypothetical protein